MNNNLGIGDLSIGVSVKGAYDYLDGINRGAIDKAISALTNYKDVFNVFEQGWQGKAEANFEKNLMGASQAVSNELEHIKKEIESLVSAMLEDWAEQDDKMVEVEDVVNF